MSAVPRHDSRQHRKPVSTGVMTAHEVGEGVTVGGERVDDGLLDHEGVRLVFDAGTEDHQIYVAASSLDVVDSTKLLNMRLKVLTRLPHVGVDPVSDAFTHVEDFPVARVAQGVNVVAQDSCDLGRNMDIGTHAAMVSGLEAVGSTRAACTGDTQWVSRSLHSISSQMFRS